MVAGPSGKQSGNVTVRVAPDTRWFARELKAYLTKLEKSLRVKVKVGVDGKQAVAETRELKRRLESTKVNLKVNLNENVANQSISRFSRRAANLGAPLIFVGNQFATIGRSIDRATNSMIRLRKAAGDVVSYMVELTAVTIRDAISVANAKKAWAGLSSAIQAASRAAKKIPQIVGQVRDLAISGAGGVRVGVQALLDGEKWASRYQKTMAKAKETVDKVGNSLQKVSTGVKSLRHAETWARGATVAMYGTWNGLIRINEGFDRLRRTGFKAISTGMHNLGASAVSAGRKASKSLGNLADGAIKGLGRGISGVVKGLGTIFTKTGEGMSKVGNAFLSLGRVGGMVVGVLALIAPLLGMIVGLLAALPALALVAGAAIGAIALGMDGIKRAASVAGPALDKLKSAVSSTFEKELTPVFQRVADVLLPGITKGMQGVASALSSNASAFFDVVTSAEGMTQINAILENTQAFLRNLNPFITEMTKSFLTAGQVGTSVFGDFAKGLSSWATQFNAMIQAAVQTGLFESALRGLGQVLGAVGSLFLDLFQSGMVMMAAIGGPFSTMLTAFGALFVALTPALIEISNLASNVLAPVFSALVPILDALNPAIRALGSILSTSLAGVIRALTPVLTALAKIVGDLLVKAFEALEPILAPVIDFLVQLGTIVGDFLLQAFTALSPAIDLLAQFVKQLLLAVTPLLPPLLQLAQVILQAVMTALSPLLPVIQQLAETLFPMVLQVVNMLVPVISQLAMAFALVLPEIAKLVAIIGQTMVPVLEGLLAVVQRVWPQIQGIIEGAMRVISGILDVVMGVISGDWSRVWEGMKKIASGAVKAIWEAIKGGFNLIVSFFMEMPGRLLGALGDLGGLLYEAGKSLIRGFIEGIKRMVGKAVEAVKSLVSEVRNFFPFSPAKVGPFSGRGYTTWSGKALVEDFAKSIRDTAPIAVSAIDDMMSATSAKASAEWNGHIGADDFGSVGDQVAKALNGVEFKADGYAIARLVNKRNNKNGSR
jgi:phage-related protein